MLSMDVDAVDRLTFPLHMVHITEWLTRVVGTGITDSIVIEVRSREC